MKKIILSLTALASLFPFAFSQTQVITGPAVSVDKEVHDYGTIPYDGNGMCEFNITNSGTEPLLILDCIKVCGCTTPAWDTSPILPGKSTVIKVKYDTKRVGPFEKKVTIVSNATNEPHRAIYIKGTIAPDPNTPASDHSPVKAPAGPIRN